MSANPNSLLNWPASYRQIPAIALSQTNPTTIQMAQVVQNFAWPRSPLTYNARTFTISKPGLYFVTIYDPTLAGDQPSETNLTAYRVDRSQQNGQPGYVYCGSILATAAGPGTPQPGGYPPGSGLDTTWDPGAQKNQLQGSGSYSDGSRGA
jgi:hypothetical protein